MATLHDQIERDLRGGATVVTPSSERASAVRLAFGSSEVGRGRGAWRTPDVIAYRAWLEREAFRAADAGASLPRPLRAAEEWLLWREAAAAALAGTERSERHSALESAPAAGGALGDADARLAEALSRAARVMHEWQIPAALLDRSGLPESELLGRALEWVERRGLEAHALPSHALSERLRECRSPQPVTFAGFAEVSVARRAWMTAASERATSPPREHSSEDRPGRALIARPADPAEELRLAADWCALELAADPARRLLVVIPDLEQRRAEAVRLLEEALAPRGFLEGAEEALVAVASGEPLAAQPLVAHDLAGLHLLTGSLGFAELSAWLRDAFWGKPTAEERARLDAWLRRVIGFEVSPRELEAALGRAPAALAAAARVVRDALAVAERALGDPGEVRSTRDWALRFAAAREPFRQAGPRPSPSAEPAAAAEARFIEILEDFAALGGRLGTLAAPQALDLLESLAVRTTFRAAAGEAAVTVTSALADPVVRYDGIWVGGLHAEAWPAAPRLDPFIPIAAQRRAGIPWATPAGCLASARRLLECWRRCAGTLVVSAPARLEDRDCLPSPLLAELAGAEPFIPGERRTTLAQRIRASRRTETFVDAEGAVWPVRSALPSGTRALDYQARCPFRAYAELRLASSPLEVPRPGVDFRDRGRLMHRALEHLWRQLGGSQSLEQQARSGQLERLIGECLALAAVETRTAAADSSGRAAQRRELRRAARLIRELAEYERQRGAFRVSALETQRSLVLGAARLDVRIDRIDELDDGTQVILDYKTGKPASLDWLGERLTDPQLLIYLLALSGEVSAVAALHLAAERIGVRGMADRPGRLPRLAALPGAEEQEASSAWKAQTGRWREALVELARDFLAGTAAVDPAAGACRSCHLEAFCRVSERND